MALVIKLTIKDLIQKRGISQKELANLTGIREATISSMCKNYLDKANLGHLAKISQALNITDMNDLLRIEEENM